MYVNNKEITTGDQTGILNKSFAYTDRIKLNYLQNVFSIGFSTDNFLHIGGGEVEYRLIGSNENGVRIVWGMILLIQIYLRAIMFLRSD